MAPWARVHGQRQHSHARGRQRTVSETRPFNTDLNASRLALSLSSNAACTATRPVTAHIRIRRSRRAPSADCRRLRARRACSAAAPSSEARPSAAHATRTGALSRSAVSACVVQAYCDMRAHSSAPQRERNNGTDVGGVGGQEAVGAPQQRAPSQQHWSERRRRRHCALCTKQRRDGITFASFGRWLPARRQTRQRVDHLASLRENSLNRRRGAVSAPLGCMAATSAAANAFWPMLRPRRRCERRLAPTHARTCDRRAAARATLFR